MSLPLKNPHKFTCLSFSAKAIEIFFCRMIQPLSRPETQNVYPKQRPQGFSAAEMEECCSVKFASIFYSFIFVKTNKR